MANLRDVIVTDEAWEFLDQIFNGENGILWENELKVRKAFDEKEMDMGNAWDKDVLDSGATSLANLIIIRAIYEGKIDPSRKRVLRRGDVWLGWYDFGETRPTDCIWPWPCP